MKHSFRLDDARFEVLIANDFEAFLGLDTSKNHVLINPAGNRDIAIDTLFRVQPMRIEFLPELLVVKRFEPLFNFRTVFKFLHMFIVPKFGFEDQEKSSKRCTT